MQHIDIREHRLPFKTKLSPYTGSFSLGVFFHMFYEEYADEMFSLLRFLPKQDVPVYVSTDTEEKKAHILEAAKRNAVQTITVRVLPNTGWDIAPFLLGFAEEIRNVDICLRLHSKKSAHMTTRFHPGEPISEQSSGTTWRHMLYDSLCGSREQVETILANFTENPKVGMICPDHWPELAEWITIGDNYPWMSRILSRMDVQLNPDDPIDFPSGSMFWCRSEALKPLLDLHLNWSDFEVTNTDKRDMTLAHAIERLFFFSCVLGGYDWSRISQPSLPVSAPESSISLELKGKTLSRRVKDALLPLAHRYRPLHLLHSFYAEMCEHGFRYALYRFFRYLSQKALPEIPPTNPAQVPLAEEAVPACSVEKKPNLSEEERREQVLAPGVDPTVQLIAYYLPQFHPFPENNSWWGEGFTEWTNVTRAKALFTGHHQPLLPSAMGFYDLRLPETMKKQIEKAKAHGIYGFCFHHYWFSGKRLMERPVDQFLADTTLDMPFCLDWANENWTRRWDGFETDILIAQKHSPEDDRAFMEDVLRYMRDPRYIRVDGRPVLLVYRPSLLPNAAETVARWKDVCREQGEKDPYLVMCQSFNTFDPAPFGFDAAVQFPPHYGAPTQTEFDHATVENLAEGFEGTVYKYASLAEKMLEGGKTQYPTYLCVAPGWDNTARRGLKAHVFAGNSPKEYASWLYEAGVATEKRFPENERFLFINAWNEWAEGAILEPDQENGYAYLNATSRTLERLAKK